MREEKQMQIIILQTNEEKCYHPTQLDTETRACKHSTFQVGQRDKELQVILSYSELKVSPRRGGGETKIIGKGTLFQAGGIFAQQFCLVGKLKGNRAVCVFYLLIQGYPEWAGNSTPSIAKLSRKRSQVRAGGGFPRAELGWGVGRGWKLAADSSKGSSVF